MFRPSLRRLARVKIILVTPTPVAPTPGRWIEPSIIVGLGATGYGVFWSHIGTLQAKSSEDMKELKDIQTKIGLELKDAQTKIGLELKDMQAKSDAQFQLQLAQIQAITKYGYSSRMVLCQEKALNPDDFTRCMNTQMKCFDFAPSTSGKMELESGY